MALAQQPRQLQHNLGQPVPPDSKARLGNPDSRDNPDSKVTPGKRGNKETPARRGTLAYKETLGCRDSRDNRRLVPQASIAPRTRIREQCIATRTKQLGLASGGFLIAPPESSSTVF